MLEQSSIKSTEKKSTEKSAESLRAALGCLDLSLESELALFRRQSQAPKALVGSPDIDEQVALSIGIQEAVEPRAEEELAPHLEEPIDQQTEFEGITPDLMQEASDARNLVYLSGPSQEDPETLPEPYGADITAEPQSFERFLDPSIEDYLESSEALLKHLEDSASSTTERQVKPLTRRSWVSGLKAIAITLGLLGLLSLVVFLIVAWLTPKSRQPEPTPQLSPQPTQVPSTSSQSSQIDSSGIAVATTPKALPSDVATVSPPTQSPARLTSPSPSPSASVNKAAFYAVVANYNNPESLKMAQKLVPDAYLNEVGGQQRIQLAWLDNLQKAETLVKDLKNKGFVASIVAQN
jgi:hypothetical protein